MSKLKVRRGLKADLPVLEEAEIGFTTDTTELFIGTSTGTNIKPVGEKGDPGEPGAQGPQGEPGAAGYVGYVDTPETLDIKTKGPIADVRAFEATGDGVTDDTTAFVNALASGCGIILVPDGTYMLSALSPYLTPASNTTIILSPQATLKIIPNDQALHYLFYLTDTENITISGGTIEGDRAGHIGAGSPHGMGIGIYGSTNVRIENMTIKDCWGDGIYISKSATTRSENITIDNVVGTNNRRQGVSVIDGKNIKINGCVFKYSNGNDPQSGIDLEPNAGQVVEDVVISDTDCTNNTGMGLQLLGVLGELRNITIENCRLNNNTGAGLVMANAYDVYINHTRCNNNGSNGVSCSRDLEMIYFYDCQFNDNAGKGTGLSFTTQTKISSNIHFYDCYTEGNTGTNSHGIQVSSDDYTNYPPTNISLNNCIYKDNAGRGISIGTGSLDISVVDCISGTANGNVSADSVPFNMKQRIPYYGYISTAGRPTTDLGNAGWAFDYTLQRPIFWHNAGTKWINADGKDARADITYLSGSSGLPASGTYEVRDKAVYLGPVADGYECQYCLTAGTQGTLSGVTGSINSATTALTVNTTTGLTAGNYITIAGVSGIKKITAIVGTTVTINSASSATVTGAAVAYSPAVFKGLGKIEA